MPNVHQQMTQDLTCFQRSTDSGPMLVRVNLASWDILQRDPHPWRIWAVTTLKAPDSAGFADAQESPLLAEAEKDLAALIADGTGTIFVGSIEHQCQHVAVLHSKSPNALSNTPTCRINGRKYRWDVYTEGDSQYEFVRHRVIPSLTEMRRLRDAEVLRALALVKDNQGVPRPITFYGMFPRLRDAEMAAIELTRKGFRPSAPSEVPARSAYTWSLMFQRVSPTDPESIERITSNAEALCASCNGYFDGWECEPQGG